MSDPFLIDGNEIPDPWERYNIRSSHETLYFAERLIRKQHRILDDDWLFWGSLADMMNGFASRTMHGVKLSAPELRTINHLLSMANNYILQEYAAVHALHTIDCQPERGDDYCVGHI